MSLSQHPQNYFNELKKAIDLIDFEKVRRLIVKIQGIIGSNRTLFIAGNGGSAATSSHMACDFAKTILGKNPRKSNKRLRVISLNDSVPLMTAWCNDEGYQYLFSEQLRNLGTPGDLVMVLTGSGNSPNILEMAQTAKEMGIETFGLLGFTGGKAKEILDDCLVVNSDNYGIIEDMHGIINHLITDFLKRNPGQEDDAFHESQVPSSGN